MPDRGAQPGGAELFDAMFGNAPIGVSVIDVETSRLVNANPEMARLLECPRDDLVGRRWEEFVFAEDLDALRERVAEALDGGSVRLEGRYRTASGAERWGLSSISVTDALSPVECIDLRLVDTTSRRESETRLRRSNALLDALYRAQTGYIGGIAPAVLFDRLLGAMLDLTESEYGFIGEVLETDDGAPFLRTHAITDIAWNEETRAFYDEYAPDRMEFYNLDTLFGTVMTSGEPVIANDPAGDPRRGGLPDGHPALNAFLGVPFYKGDRMVGMVGVANRPGGYDGGLVTELKPLLATVANIIDAHGLDRARQQAEDRLREREERLSAIVGLAADGIVALDGEGRIQSVNPAAERIFGRAAAEMREGNLFDIIDEDGDEAAVAQLLRVGEPLTVEMEGIRGDGSRFPLEISVSRASGGEAATVTAVVRDVSERKEIETALRSAKEAAERASGAKDEFLAGMSHELRTPLNAVIGLAGVLQRETFGPLTDKQREYVGQIGTSANHLLELINDVLDLAKISADRVDLELGPVDIRGVIADAVSLVREEAVAGGLRLDVQVDANVPEFLIADGRRIKQVLINLLHNAVKFTPEGGVVGVAAARDGDILAITVWDTGVGIPGEAQEQLFEPFQRVDATLTRSHGGTGLGLALSSQLVALHGGSIGVESEVGAGTRFTVRLPLAAASAPAAEQPAERPDSSRPASGIRVLLVEDNEVNRLVVTDHLEAHGVEVFAAADGLQAIERARELVPDVILMDVQLPKLDGLAATRRLKGEPETRSIPVVALTALAMRGDAERCLEAGCDAYLAKPCDPEDVLAAVQELL